ALYRVGKRPDVRPTSDPFPGSAALTTPGAAPFFGGRFNRLENPIRAVGQARQLGADRSQGGRHGIGDCAEGTDGTGLTNALAAQQGLWTGGLNVLNLDPGDV